MLREDKVNFVKDFLKRNHLVKKISYEMLLNDLGELTIAFEKDKSFTVKTNVLNVKNGRNKMQVIYVGKKIFENYSKEELISLFTEIRIFVSYVRELKLLKKIENEINERENFINSLEDRFFNFN